jgi:hypothetical protein
MKSARAAFNSGKYQAALTGVRQARKLKDTREARALEQDIVRVSAGLEDEKRRVAEEERLKSEREYSKYLQRAQAAYKNGQYRAAKANLNQARRYKKTGDLDSLERKIDQALRQRSQTPVAKLIDLPSGMVNKYNETVKHIEVANIGRGIKVLGQFSLTFQVQPNGRLNIQRANDSQLKITPSRARRPVKAKIFAKITSIFLSPPIDKLGKSVTVRDWRVTYQAGTFMGKVILRRKF